MEHTAVPFQYPAMPKIMADPRLNPTANPMLFDGKRMIYGRFEVLVHA